ncbi:MAG: cation transporter [Candidatus Hydrogenedentes bacterium]|nr:cation transporter [Candidatus Hydrogenedentota bacterium]
MYAPRASIPIALSFIHLGASPGAALAFLIAGPATNAATIATVWKVMGKTTAAIYLSTVFVGAIISGLLFDILDRVWDIPMVYEGAVEGHTPVSAGMNIFWALLLAGVVLHSIYGDRLLFLWKKKAGSIPLENAEGICIKLTLTGMTCSHCAAAVTNALNRISGVENTEVEFASGSVTVRGDTVSAETLITAVEELGYKVTLTR